jgi:tetratricopeptide (TPR) repeat protein
MRYRIFVLTAALFSSLAIAANPINRETFARYYKQAEAALAAGDLQTAEIAYSRALLNARLAGDMPPAAEAGLAQKLARVQGNLCKHDEAERMFLEAIGVAERAFGVDSLRIFPLRVELAQLTYDIGAYPKAVAYFDRALSVGGRVLREKDPAGLTLLLEDYAVALDKSGRAEDAARVAEDARSLRDKGGAATAVRSKEQYIPYPKVCK